MEHSHLTAVFTTKSPFRKLRVHIDHLWVIAASCGIFLRFLLHASCQKISPYVLGWIATFVLSGHVELALYIQTLFFSFSFLCAYQHR